MKNVDYTEKTYKVIYIHNGQNNSVVNYFIKEEF